MAKALDHYQARRLVVGHTETRRIVSLFGGWLVTICQRMSARDRVDEAAATELPVIERHRAFGVPLNGTRTPL